MKKKNSRYMNKTPPRQFLILISDLAETVKRTVNTEQTH